MKVPPWKCKTAEDQKAFAFFVMRKLHEPDEAAAEAYVNSPVPAGFMEYMDIEARKHEVALIAQEHGLEIKPPSRPRGRPKGEITALICAIRDAERMREMFLRYWNKPNRYTRPTRTDMAAEYWGLSEEETDALERHFTKAKKSER